MDAASIHKRLDEKFRGRIVHSELEVVDPFLVVDKDAIVDIGTYMRDEPDLAFDMLHCLSGVDCLKDERIEIVYHLTSLKNRHWIVLKVYLPRSGARMPTVENVWKTANWHERETYDLYGVVFEGHSDFRRILLPEDWPGHPLLKDWEWPDEWHGIPVKPGDQMSKRAMDGEEIGIGPFD